MPHRNLSLPQAPLQVRMDKRGVLHLDIDLLRHRLAELDAGAPVVAMVHGYRFAPDAGPHCPFGHIFAIDPDAAHLRKIDRKLVSWPRHLGLGGAAGLAIAFGWPARGTLGAVNHRAALAGAALARLAALIVQIDPARQLDIIAHSLGARAALASLMAAEAGHMRRLILLAAAETRGPALRALRSPAGAGVQVVNVTTRENDVFDFIYEWGVRLGRDTAIGQGLGCAMPNWLNLQLDDPRSLAALAAMGHALPVTPARICHWSPYIRPGVFGLYRAVLDGSLALNDLAANLPSAQARRWSALFSARSAA
jgi:hypothetical protein